MPVTNEDSGKLVTCNQGTGRLDRVLSTAGLELAIITLRDGSGTTSAPSAVVELYEPAAPQKVVMSEEMKAVIAEGKLVNGHKPVLSLR